MRIREIRHHQLQAYIDSEEYKRSEFVAISKHRALSQLRNPRAKAEDLVLVLIYEGGEMVAYLGVLPDDFYFATGVEHVGWMTCIWVNPKMRGKGVAKKLLNTVFEAWDYKVLGTGFTPTAYGLYQRTGQFMDLAKPKGLRGYLRLNLAYLLSKKDPKWNKWKPFLTCIDVLFNIPNALRLKFYPIHCPKFEYLSEIDAEAWAFVQATKGKELMNRNREDLQWIMRNPWLISSELNDHNAERYHFSATDKLFNFLTIKVYDNDLKMIGFLMLSIRDKQLKIPYIYYKKGAEEAVLQVVYKHLLELKLDMLTIFHQPLVEHLKNNTSPFFMKRNFQRHYIIGKVLREQLAATNGFIIQDGDADEAFT